MNTVSPTKAIVLIGLKHSGKSTIARMMAPFIGKISLDVDERLARVAESTLIADGHEIASGIGYQAINRQFYSIYGKAEFQALETKVTSEIVASPDLANLIIATGGGVMENTVAMTLLRPKGFLVFIHVPEGVLFSRIMRGGLPPFLDKTDPEGSFHTLYTQRTTLARSYADVEVTVEQQAVEHVLALVLKSIKEHGHGR
jgi:shikimate kinase